MKNTDAIIISIANQYWLGEEEYDLSSHGEMLLRVNNTIITQPGADEEWGIGESALAMLRSLSGEDSGDSEKILHGCGTMLMLGCPISIHWTVAAEEGMVKLSNFSKIETTDPATGTRAYPELIAFISQEAYREQVIQFAKTAKAFFTSSKPKSIEDNDNEMYEAFWQEFDELLEKYD